MVVGPDGFDLLGCDRVPPGTQSLANGARLVFWMMKEIDENVDDTSGMQFLGSRWRGEFLSFRPLPKPASRQWAERQKLAPPPAPKEPPPAPVHHNAVLLVMT